ncbi:AbfB domain-containing protein [Paractinoplanes globisporus]|uniref:AbfB domain-containing protein n=1 Tax=Paractinoplanes globisporus TaxID=113565 RepID=A0ABW6W9H0_9ACTN|nr:AbfB domain-containing protein [Actinoplanes globisporus]
MPDSAENPLWRAARAVGTHPLAALVTVAALGLGIALIVVGWTVSVPDAVGGPRPRPPYGASPPAGSFPMPGVGSVSLESADAHGRFLGVSGDSAALVAVGPGSPEPERRLATFTVLPGLADSECFSFRASDGRFLRRSASRLRVGDADAGDPFRLDATFCVRGGAAPRSVALESLGERGSFVRHTGDQIVLGPLDTNGSFLVRRPLF